MEAIEVKTVPAAEVDLDALRDLGVGDVWITQWQCDSVPTATMALDAGQAVCVILWTKMQFDPKGEQGRPHMINYIYTRTSHRRRGLAFCLIGCLDPKLDWNTFCSNDESESLFRKAWFKGSGPLRRRSACTHKTVKRALSIYVTHVNTRRVTLDPSARQALCNLIAFWNAPPPMVSYGKECPYYSLKIHHVHLNHQLLLKQMHGILWRRYTEMAMGHRLSRMSRAIGVGGGGARAVDDGAPDVSWTT